MGFAILSNWLVRIALWCRILVLFGEAFWDIITIQIDVSLKKILIYSYHNLISRLTINLFMVLIIYGITT